MDDEVLLEEDRIFTAKKARVVPEDLVFSGKQSLAPIEDAYIFLWTVLDKQSELYLSSIAGKKYQIERSFA